MIDRYTKFILTVIAISLLGLVIILLLKSDIETKAYAVDKDNVTNVRIVEIELPPWQGPLPVRISK